MKNLLILLYLFFSVFFFSCEKENNEEIRPTVNSNRNLTFNSFFPQQALMGEYIILSVRNFNMEVSGTNISIGEATADFVIIDESTIKVKIPYNSVPGFQTITIRSNGQVVTHENRILIFNSRL